MANAAGPDPVGREKAVGVRLSLSGPNNILDSGRRMRVIDLLERTGESRRPFPKHARGFLSEFRVRTGVSRLSHQTMERRPRKRSRVRLPVAYPARGQNTPERTNAVITRPSLGLSPRIIGRAPGDAPGG